MIPIVLDLSRHCIETEINRLYNRLISDYFRKNGTCRELEHRIDILYKALESYDFCSLRARYKALCGNSTARIRLESNGRDAPLLTINDCPVDDCRRVKEKERP